MFQRLARDWDNVYPYNAAQMLRVRGRVDAGAAERAWGAAMAVAGVGRVSLNGRGYHHEILNGELARYPLRVLQPGMTVQGHVSDELNRPFADPGEPPFRPFLAVQEDGTSCLGVVYQHWVADSVAIRLLLREWFVRLFDPGATRPTPLEQPTQGYWGLFGPSRPGWRGAETLWAVVRRHMRYRRARKVKTFGTADYPVRVLFREAPVGLIDALCTRARSEGHKVNDLFIAAAAEACHCFVPAQHRRGRRDLAVASIVDLRRHAAAGVDLGQTFGLFLGFSEAICRPAELADFPRLVRAIGRQTRQHRHTGIPQSSLSWLMIAGAVRRLVRPEKLYHFYRKETPLLAGVSNVNINPSWAAAYHPASLLEYVRVSPTGPLAPLVFTLTTLGHRLHLSLTYRAVLLDEAAAGQLADAFLARLATLA